MYLSQNIKALRQGKDFSQAELAKELSISREMVNAYERGSQPPLEVMIGMSSLFKVTLDQFVKQDLTQKTENHKAFYEHDLDLEGKHLRLLTLTLDSNGNENIALINHKAQAGYSSGYADPSFFEQLPMFSLPFLDRTQTYRCFQISGDSMLPMKDGEWIIGSYVQNWKEIKAGKKYIVALKSEGVVFKRVYPELDRNQLLLVSDNAIYKPYNVYLKDVIEVWEFSSYWEKSSD